MNDRLRFLVGATVVVTGLPFLTADGGAGRADVVSDGDTMRFRLVGRRR